MKISQWQFILRGGKRFSLLIDIDSPWLAYQRTGAIFFNNNRSNSGSSFRQSYCSIRRGVYYVLVKRESSLINDESCIFRVLGALLAEECEPAPSIVLLVGAYA